MANTSASQTFSVKARKSGSTKRFTPLTEAEYKGSGAWGMATSVDIHGCKGDLIRSKEAIVKFTHELCNRIDMKRFGDTVCVHFGAAASVAGYSMTQLIETSLVSAHFANETNSVYLDVFSCKFYDAQAMIDFALEFFGGKSFNAHCLLRGCEKFPKAYQKQFSDRNIVLNSAPVHA